MYFASYDSIIGFVRATPISYLGNLTIKWLSDSRLIATFMISALCLCMNYAIVLNARGLLRLLLVFQFIRGSIL